MNKTCVYIGPAQNQMPLLTELKRVLFDRGYKDFAPTELRRDIAKCSTYPARVAEIIIYGG